MAARGWLLVLGSWCAMALVAWPFQPFPFVDDWVYAWSVEHLLADRRLAVLDFSSNIVLAQAVWGALFCLPVGFSFVALRLSTWVLGGIALVGVMRLLRECGATERTAAFGAATLAAYPPFLVLSFSFMTDVPLVAAETWALVFYVRAWRTRSSTDLWIGTTLVAVATGIRVVGLVPALAMAAALACDPRGWGRRSGRFLIPPGAVVVAGALSWYHQQHVHRVADLSFIQNTPEARLLALREHGITLLPAWLPLSLEFMAVGLGLALLAAAAALAWRREMARRVWMLLGGLLAVSVAGHMTGGLHYPVFSSEGTWLSEELGAVVTLLPGWTPVAIPPWMTAVATLIAVGSWLVLAAAATPPREPDDPQPVLWWTLGGLVLMTAVLWLATDRYILAFMPPALGLVLGRGAAIDWRRGAVALAVFATIGGVALRDRNHAERAVWTAVDDLRRAGVAPGEIDAGYVVNGWLQYAHPAGAHRDAAGQVSVPFINGDVRLRWAVTARPLPGAELVRTYPFARLGRTPGHVYVIRWPSSGDERR